MAQDKTSTPVNSQKKAMDLYLAAKAAEAAERDFGKTYIEPLGPGEEITRPDNFLYEALSNPKLNRGLSNLGNAAAEVVLGKPSGSDAVDMGAGMIPGVGAGAILAAGGMPGALDLAGIGEAKTVAKGMKNLSAVTRRLVKGLWGDEELDKLAGIAGKYDIRPGAYDAAGLLGKEKEELDSYLIETMGGRESLEFLENVLYPNLSETARSDEYLQNVLAGIYRGIDEADPATYYSNLNRFMVMGSSDMNNGPSGFQTARDIVKGLSDDALTAEVLQPTKSGNFKLSEGSMLGRMLDAAEAAQNRRWPHDYSSLGKKAETVEQAGPSEKELARMAELEKGIAKAEQKNVSRLNPKQKKQYQADLNAKKNELANLKKKYSNVEKPAEKPAEEPVYVQPVEKPVVQAAEPVSGYATVSNPVTPGEVLASGWKPAEHPLPLEFDNNGMKVGVSEPKTYAHVSFDANDADRRNMFVADSLAGEALKRLYVKDRFRQGDYGRAFSKSSEARHSRDMVNYNDVMNAYRDEIEKAVAEGRLGEIMMVPKYKKYSTGGEITVKPVIGADGKQVMTPGLSIGGGPGSGYIEKYRIVDEKGGPTDMYDIYDMFLRRKLDDVLEAANPTYRRTF